MICISNKEEVDIQTTSKPKEKNNKKESKYLLKVVYDSEDTKVHKLLEGIFGEEQMLDVKNGKIAKISSTLTPKERDCFFEMVSETLNKVSGQEEKEDYEDDDNYDDDNLEEIAEEDEIIDEEENEIEKETKINDEQKDSKKVSAEKLIKEFASFLNSIS